MTIIERRKAEVERKLKLYLNARERALATLTGIENAIKRLRQRQAYYAKKVVKVEPKAPPVQDKPSNPSKPASKPDSGIPGFLRRDKSDGDAADKKAADEIRDNIAEQKRTKANARIAKLKADKAGDRKKMPLQGREALAAIQAKG